VKKTSIALGLTMLLAQVNGHAFEAIAAVTVFRLSPSNHIRPAMLDRNPADDSSRAAATQLLGAIIGGVAGGLWQHRRQG